MEEYARNSAAFMTAYGCVVVNYVPRVDLTAYAGMRPIGEDNSTLREVDPDQVWRIKRGSARLEPQAAVLREL